MNHDRDPQTQIETSVTEMFARRASRGTGDGLRGPILAAIRTTPQRRGPLARLRDAVDVVGAGRILVLAIVGTALIGGTLAIAGGSSRGPDSPDEPAIAVLPSGSPSASADATLRPLPTSTATSPSVSPGPSDGLPLPPGAGLSGPSRAVDFGKPFSFVVPDDLHGAWLIQDYDRIYALAVAHDASLPTDSTDWGVKGLAVTILEEPVAHPCPAGGPRTPIRTDPVGIVEDLRELSGITLTRIGSALVDGHEAVVFDLDPGPCDFNDIHVGPGLSFGKFVPTDRPERLILTTVNESPMGIFIWADTPEQLDAWVDQVQPIVDSIQFRD